MRYSIKDIMKDLVQHIKDEGTVKPSEKWRYKYDRGKWMSMMSEFGYDDYDERNEDYEYEYSLETLRTLIYQIHFFGHVIHTNDDGKDIYNNNIIRERRQEI